MQQQLHDHQSCRETDQHAEEQLSGQRFQGLSDRILRFTGLYFPLPPDRFALLLGYDTTFLPS
ncbi:MULTISPECIES: hypothetical protein [Paenibacillus]|uniref:Uncharacterized protein n=1 Tax=Paenibacillus lactis TaxID=228574 RepID=A0ABS4F9I8_9BACL|nr:hypothetical protein [Paenibacillus lactis]MBP1892916.1 hypothetical protein [Paenibacillus lactis]